MVHLRRPSQSEIEARLSSHDISFSYPEVAATAGTDSSLPESLAAKYDIDQHQFPLGTGRDLFERARAALVEWRHFEIPWLELHRATSPVHSGQVVATLVSLAGIWFLNPCRVVYTELPEAPSNLAAFAYGTLRGHAECGEERFAISFNPVTEEVRYELSVFSRPAILFSKLGYPLVRRLQKRFALSSAQALARAAAFDDDAAVEPSQQS